MKIAIFGSRTIDEHKARQILSEKMTKDDEYISSGNIKGVAEIALQIAKEKGIKITLYNYESGLGFYQALTDIAIKNKRMVKMCDSAIVIWDGKSKGTKREIEMLKKKEKPFSIFIINQDGVTEQFSGTKEKEPIHESIKPIEEMTDGQFGLFSL